MLMKNKFYFTKLDKNKVDNLEDSCVKSKYLKLEYRNVSFIKSYYYKSNVHSYIFKCCCGDYIDLTASNMNYWYTKGALEYIDCGCINKLEKDKQIQHHLEVFNTKTGQSEENPYYCSYCESYRGSLSKVWSTNYCNSCKFLIKNRVSLGKSFEDIMKEWNPNCHKNSCKKLPYMKGNCKKGYKVAGFTYVDNDVYENASKLLWVKVKNYVKMHLSKDNCTRLEITKPLKNNSVFLHRYVLGLGNSVKDWVGDHISGVKLDNRLSNLRVCNSQENSLNSIKKFKEGHHTSIYKGVSRDSRSNMWRTTCQVNGSWYSKLWGNEIDAAKHYDEVLRTRYPSDFNRYNFPRESELSALTNKGF